MRMEEKREEKQGFWARKNIVFSLERYFIDALGAMALGLFSSLIVGLILATLGEQLTKLMGEKAMLTFLINSGKTAQSMMGPPSALRWLMDCRHPLVLFMSLPARPVRRQAVLQAVLWRLFAVPSLVKLFLKKLKWILSSRLPSPFWPAYSVAAVGPGLTG